MPETTAVYEARASGFWNTRHAISGEEGPLGVLSIRRNWHGMVTGGEFRPDKGEVLILRRDPGLLRSQFSMWTDGQEWLGSSLRWSFFGRRIAMNTGGKPFTLQPTPRLGKGWILQAPKTGLTARITAGLAGRRSRLEVYRRLDFPLLLFSYFVGWQIYAESVWPARKPHGYPF